MPNNSLKKYTGSWDNKNAIHLLNRTVFGYKYEDLQEVLTFGFDKTIDKLFEDISKPPPPIHYSYDQEPEVPLGSTWVLTKQPIPAIAGLNNNRRNTLRAWQTGLFHESGIHIREKLVMFWHDHMPIAAISNARFEFQYLDLLRTHALGNFKSMVEDITVSPAMLRYLNGDENTKEAPNENYSRELLELFTVGRGLEQGNGDYTNYTETDVIELARALTGWRVSNPVGELPKGFFTSNRHDDDQKQLSERLNSQIISNGGSLEYKNAIDAIFKSDEVARFICRKLHVWFVDAEITDDIETDIIRPMAQIMIDDNYDIKRALKTLISSEYFHDEAKHGCMITSPTDFVFKVLNTVKLELDIDFDAKMYFWSRLHTVTKDLEMTILEVPSVAGWKAFYQAPQYYKYWINSVTLVKRDEFLSLMERGFTISGVRYGLDYLNTISNFEDVSDPDKLIEQLVEYLFSVPITTEQIEFLKEGFLGSGSNNRWTNAYNNYLSNPSTSNTNTATNMINDLFNRMLRMPEFQLM